jgi:CAAX prenyl protease-like protein
MTIRGLTLTFDAARLRLADARSSAFDYTMPIVVFGVFTAMEGQLPLSWYPLLYLIKVCAVTLSLVLCRGVFSDIRPSRRFVVPAVIVGGAVFAAWVGIDKWVPYPHLGTRVGFNPFESLDRPGVAAAFVVVRLYGLCLLVPVMEELFWRSFLLRYLTTTQDFESMPVGAFSWSAFWLVALVFGVAHPEWLPAVVTACAYALLLRQTKSLFAVVVAHAVTNGALGIYILLSHDWQYW